MSKLGVQSTYNVLYYKYETKRKRHLFICNNCLFRLEITSMKEKFTKEQIEQMLNTSTEKNVENSVDLVDEFGNVRNIGEVITQAENDVKKKYPKVNFRWSEFEIARAKKIAKELGMPYQTYIKSLLKQGMDNDEKRLKQI